MFVFFFSSRRRHTRCGRDWSSDVCSSDLIGAKIAGPDDPAVRCPATLYSRPEGDDQQVVPHQCSVQEKGHRPFSESPAPEHLAVAHCNERRMPRLFPPEKITCGVAYERGT